MMERKRFWSRRRVALAVAATVVAGSAWMAAEVISVGRGARTRVFDDVARVPASRVGLVLGCAERLSDGRPNLFFAYRIRAAAELYAAGKVEYLLVSGDNGTASYDEPTAMKAALVRAGVPEDRVVLDYAGFRTLDSVVRAREVFGQTRVTIVSQRFHNERAVFLARRHGIAAYGYNAPDVGGAEDAMAQAREVLARVKAVLDVRVLGTRPRFLGEPVPIGPVADAS